jgi:hypothetical protein
MKKPFKLLQKIGITRVKPEDEDADAFDKRLKKVNRARVVNQAGLGGPVFKSRSSETEAGDLP